MKSFRLRFFGRESNQAAGSLLLRPFGSRRGFSLLQIIVTISIIAILSAILFGFMGRGKSTARRAQCDTQLKAITLALDAFKQENGKFPKTLAALHNEKYLRDSTALRCPSDPRQSGQGGYEEFYIVRSARGADDMPFVVCPFHEEDGAVGMQAFKGRYTAQHITRRSRITAARGGTILRPGKAPIAATVGMELRGGDRISTDGAATNGVLSNTSGGKVVIEFADGSTATLGSGTSATVLQSFMMGQTRAPLYTLIRQGVGEAVYRITPGSKFDVVTPTATSGARGTEFRVTVKPDGETALWVYEGEVAFTTLDKTVIAPLGKVVSGLLGGIIKIL